MLGTLASLRLLNLSTLVLTGAWAGVCPRPGTNLELRARVLQLDSALMRVEGLPASMGNTLVRTEEGFFIPGIFNLGSQNGSFGCPFSSTSTQRLHTCSTA